nr:MAG TPA: hypothetical protein [Caudoviricetes sp.]
MRQFLFRLSYLHLRTQAHPEVSGQFQHSSSDHYFWLAPLFFPSNLPAYVSRMGQSSSRLSW